MTCADADRAMGDVSIGRQTATAGISPTAFFRKRECEGFSWKALRISRPAPAMHGRRHLQLVGLIDDLALHAVVLSTEVIAEGA